MKLSLALFIVVINKINEVANCISYNFWIILFIIARN